MLHPHAQCGQIESPDLTSNGRAAKRYVFAVSAPTGQIWIVLPENGLLKSSPGAMDTCSAAPRSNSSMNRSPEIWSQNRVHLAHRTQRSRSRLTSGESGSGFRYVRLAST